MADTVRVDTVRVVTVPVDTERVYNEWEKVQKQMQIAVHMAELAEHTARAATAREAADTHTAREAADTAREEAATALQGRIRSIFLIGSKL